MAFKIKSITKSKSEQEEKNRLAGYESLASKQGKPREQTATTSTKPATSTNTVDVVTGADKNPAPPTQSAAKGSKVGRGAPKPTIDAVTGADRKVTAPTDKTRATELAFLNERANSNVGRNLSDFVSATAGKAVSGATALGGLAMDAINQANANKVRSNYKEYIESAKANVARYQEMMRDANAAGDTERQRQLASYIRDNVAQIRRYENLMRAETEQAAPIKNTANRMWEATDALSSGVNNSIKGITERSGNVAGTAANILSGAVALGAQSLVPGGIIASSFGEGAHEARNAGLGLKRQLGQGLGYAGSMAAAGAVAKTLAGVFAGKVASNITTHGQKLAAGFAQAGISGGAFGSTSSLSQQLTRVLSGQAQAEYDALQSQIDQVESAINAMEGSANADPWEIGVLRTNLKELQNAQSRVYFDAKRVISDGVTAALFAAVRYGFRTFAAGEWTHRDSGSTGNGAQEKPDLSKSKWFSDCETLEEMQARRRQLSRQYHPDRAGGSEEIMKEINAEFDRFSKGMPSNPMKAAEKAANTVSKAYEKAATTGTAPTGAESSRVQEGLFLLGESINATGNSEAIGLVKAVTEAVGEELGIPLLDGGTTSTPITAPAQTQAVAQKERETREQHPDSSVATTTETLVMERLGQSYEDAQRTAATITKLVNGEPVTNEEMQALNPGNGEVQKLFTELTGIVIPEDTDATNAETIMRGAPETIERIKQDVQQAQGAPTITQEPVSGNPFAGAPGQSNTAPISGSQGTGVPIQLPGAPGEAPSGQTTREDTLTKIREILTNAKFMGSESAMETLINLYEDGQDPEMYVAGAVAGYIYGANGLVTDQEWRQNVMGFTLNASQGNITADQLQGAYEAGKADAPYLNKKYSGAAQDTTAQGENEQGELTEEAPKTNAPAPTEQAPETQSGSTETPVAPGDLFNPEKIYNGGLQGAVDTVMNNPAVAGIVGKMPSADDMPKPRSGAGEQRGENTPAETEKKPTEKKPAETEKKPTESTPTEKKPTENTPAETEKKPTEKKPAETEKKPTETEKKPTETDKTPTDLTGTTGDGTISTGAESTESTPAEPAPTAEKPKKPTGEKPKQEPTKPVESAPKTEETSSENVVDGKNPSGPQQKIADKVRELIEAGKPFTSDQLFRIADEAYGGTMASGTYSVKDAYDGMELAVNQYLMNADFVKSGNGSITEAKKTFLKIAAILRNLPTQSKRSEEAQTFQQFSTPPNIAYVAAWAANFNGNDVVLEPSAGIGGLALWPKAWGATVYGNEYSPRRLEFLNQLGLDGTFNLNAEQINNVLPDNIKPTAVIMNPPFSSTAGRTSKNNTANAKRHVEQALKRLEHGGRLVAILGKGMSNDSKTFRSWWDELRKQYSIRANIRIDGKNYEKYGTTWDVQLVVIDKTGPQTGETITGEYTGLAEVFDVLEGIRNDRPRLDSGDQILDGHVRESGMEPEVDSGVQSDTGGSAIGGSRGDIVHDGRGTRDGVVRGPENQGTVGGRNSETGSSETVSGVREGSEQTGDRGERKESAGNSRGTDGRGSDRIELDRSDLKSAPKSTASADNPDNVYSEYSPRKARVKGAQKHPAKLVESAAMAAVEPPDVTYTPDLPQSLVTTGKLSDAQLEAIIYAGQAHEQKLPSGERKGFFIGDGTGFGKGTEIAGIILDNFRQGRTKAIWISESEGLINDAKRDWSWLGQDKEEIFDLSTIKYKQGQTIKRDRGIVFTRYTSLVADREGRIKLLKDWLGEDFDGVIVFDEAHNMKNAIGQANGFRSKQPAQRALAGIELQKAFPNARIVYATATGATEPLNYAYLSRLGLWGKGTAFKDANDFASQINAGGLAAMELVARDMKAMGVYIARSISYDGVAYDTLQHDLTPEQVEVYSVMSQAWQKVLQNIESALEITGQNVNSAARKRALGQFYSTQQRFFNQVLTSMAMPTVIKQIKQDLANGKSCVLQIVNTNESQTTRAVDAVQKAGGDYEDADLSPTETLVGLIEKTFPVQAYEEYTDDHGNLQSRPIVDANGKPVLDKEAVAMRDDLIAEIKLMRAPDGAIDILIAAFGPENVAEITSRKYRIVEKLDKNGLRKRELDSRAKGSKEAEVNAFQDGKKRILVFSNAGGTGRSYHADRRAKNQQPRVHYLLQAGWEAPKAVQGLGRTNRSNQVSAPTYRLVTTNVMGQKRFTSTIARRLNQLGALTRGQRQASSGIFGEKDNLENPIAAEALAAYYKTVPVEIIEKLGLYKKLYDQYGNFRDGAEEARNVSHFLNRILALEIDEQNEVFQGFYDTFESYMDAAIANGMVDMGLENYHADKIEVLDEKTVHKNPSGADTKYVQMTVYNKPNIIPFSLIEDLRRRFQGLVRLQDGSVRAVYQIANRTNEKTGKVQKQFILQSPVRRKYSTFVEETLNTETTPIPKTEWEQAWNEETAKLPKYETSTLHLLTGSLLPIWDKIKAAGVRVIRVTTDDGRQYLGRVVEAKYIDSILTNLGSERTIKHYSGHEVTEEVLKGKEAIFRDKRLTLKRSRVSGEWRLELKGEDLAFLARQYDGIIKEKIAFTYRFFVPIGPRGEAILDAIIRSNPVMGIRDTTPSSTDSLRINPDNSDDDSTTPGAPGNPNGPNKGSGSDTKKAIGDSGPRRSDQWRAERVSDNKESVRSLTDLMAELTQFFDENVSIGGVRGRGVLGTHNSRSHGIRLKSANDLVTAAHELGHHLDQIYGLTDNLTDEERRELIDNAGTQFLAPYKKKDRPGEGLAEFVRQYLTNRELAAQNYPKFTPKFLNSLSEEDRYKFNLLADRANAYFSSDRSMRSGAVHGIEERVPDYRTWKEKVKDAIDTFRTRMIDKKHGLQIFDDEYGTNAHTLALNMAYADNIAGQCLTGSLAGVGGKVVGEGLATRLHKHGISASDTQKYTDFGDYLIARNGIERLAEGLQVYGDVSLNSQKHMIEAVKKYEQMYPEFKDAAEDIYDYEYNLGLEWLVETGIVSHDQWDDLWERWENYVPFRRVLPKGDRRVRGSGGGGQNDANNPLKHAKGSGLDFINPIDSLITQTYTFISAGMENRVRLAVANAVKQRGVNATFIERWVAPVEATTVDLSGIKEVLGEDIAGLPGDDATKAKAIATVMSQVADTITQYSIGRARGNVISVLRGGHREYYKINDPTLYTALLGNSEQRVSAILKAYGRISRMMTGNLTSNDIVWAIGNNAFSDLGTALTYTPFREWGRLLYGIGSAYWNTIAEARGGELDPLYAEYLAMGGGSTNVYGADRDSAKKMKKEFHYGKLRTLLHWLNPVNFLQLLSDMIERGPRYATYRRLRMSGIPVEEAFRGAMDITTDFRINSDLSSQLNLVFQFFNANVQGVDKMVRYLTAKDTPTAMRVQVAAGRATSYLLSSALIAALFTALHRKDEETEDAYQMVSTFVKNSYYLIPTDIFGGEKGKFFAIRKPRELAVPTSFMQALAERLSGDTHAFDDFYQYMTDEFLPTPVAAIAQIDPGGLVGSAGIFGTAAYMVANRDFLGRPIEPRAMHDSKTPSAYKFTGKTSKPAYYIGKATNTSPIMWDFFLSSGAVLYWKYVQDLFPMDSSRFDPTLGLRNRYLKDSLYSNDIVNRMYERADKSAGEKKVDSGNIEKAILAKRDATTEKFYATFYNLSKDDSGSPELRSYRKTVLDMLEAEEYSRTHNITNASQDILYDAVRASGETDIMPQVMNDTITDANGITYDLNYAQYYDYQARYNGYYWKAVEDAAKTGMQGKGLAAAIKKGKDLAKQKATNDMLNQTGHGSVKSAYEGVPDDKVIQFQANKYLHEQAHGGSFKQTDAIQLLESMNITNTQRYILFHSVWESDKNNPWA